MPALPHRRDMSYPAKVPSPRFWSPAYLLTSLFACQSLLACQTTEPADPLDPDVIKEAAEAEGDGKGTDYSGTYDISVDATAACNCPTIAGMDLCHNQLTTLASVGGSVTITQNDGFLVLSEDAQLLNLTGGVDSDGGFDLAGIYAFGGVVGELSVYVHLLGAFSSDDRFSATLHSRAEGEYNGEPIDCRTEVPLYGVRKAT